ncbi:MAG: hypothetical protein PWQ30_420 [Euryarchaeota archaeon]|nr:hypothetical protein [Euryarchaeota archaeon]
MRVLITDGNFKHTLASVRSLGKRGIDVTVLSDMRLSVSFHSKYCSKSILAPNPEHDATFAEFVYDLAKREQFDVVLPISYAAVDQISRLRERLEPYVRVPLPDRASIELAGNKDKTMRLAESIGVAIPKTFYPQSLEDVEQVADSLSYPVVVKGTRENGNVGYANSAEGLISQYEKISVYSPIVQEYIPGEGYGFFALYNHGEARAIFMHRRLREYPITGGPSALAESIYDPMLMEQGLKLLDSLRWHGVAMVEFKKDERTGKYFLMEINPKFWGSLELAIASGVDFPYLTCRMACEGDIEPVFSYKTGVKFRWLFPQDIFHAMTNPRVLPRFFSDFADGTICYDIDAHDIVPNFLQIGMTVGEFALRVKQRRFWRPHGRPLL